MTAGAAGMGLAQVRLLIYRAKLNSNGEIVGGDLELDTGVNISTLSTGLKVVSSLNYTLSSNTYRNYWYMTIRNYQTGSLSIKGINNTNIVCDYSTIANSSSTEFRDMTWLWSVPYTNATPSDMPIVSAAGASTTTVAEFSQIPMIGYSSY